MKDRLFIFIAAVLLMMFAIEIFSNLTGGKSIDRPPAEALLKGENIDEILARLQKAGLQPQEAKYYKIIK